MYFIFLDLIIPRSYISNIPVVVDILVDDEETFGDFVNLENLQSPQNAH